ncbi:unnamed protein product [Adineta ricciae]|uniref:Uncharacterized protein n=1 Tax=Adineta ricciae TaxID=249248 RepID=A0A814YEL5_ADIRI|nr:unnamed protein product [Adineta ricciae]
MRQNEDVNISYSTPSIEERQRIKSKEIDSSKWDMASTSSTNKENVQLSPLPTCINCSKPAQELRLPVSRGVILQPVKISISCIGSIMNKMQTNLPINGSEPLF